MKNNNTEYAIVIKRISSEKQGLMGDSHKDQEGQILRRVEQFSATIGKRIVVKKTFNFTESGSKDFDLQPILKVLEYCKTSQNKIKYAFIKSIDRGTRGGAIIYGLLKSQFAKYGVQIVDVYGVIGTQTVNTLDHLGLKYNWSEYSPTWITELLEAERAKGEVRDILTRMIGAEIRYVRLGYRVRPAPPGYQNVKIDTPHGKRVVLAAHDIEAKWFIRMFELRAQGNLSDAEIVDEINKMGYKSRRQNKHDPIDKNKIIGFSGENPLTVKQLQRYIQNPIYAGINTEKWTDGAPVKCDFEGLVSIDLFNKANKGKITILVDGEIVKIFKGEIPKWRIKKDKANPNYPYKQYVLCSQCRSELVGSASRGKAGKYYPAYHCSRKHKLYRVPLKTFNETIEGFAEKVEFSDKFIMRFREIVLEEWEKRRASLSQDSIVIEKEVVKKKEERKLIVDRIKMLSTPAAIKAMEEELETIDQELAQMMIQRENKEQDEVDVQTLINYCQYFMEHPKELLFSSENPFQNAAMFGLLFEVPPTYQDLVDGTPKLACIFELNKQSKMSKSQLVTLRGKTSNPLVTIFHELEDFINIILQANSGNQLFIS